MQRLVPVPRLARDGAGRAAGAHYSKCSWISVRMSRPGAGPHVGRRKNRPPCVVIGSALILGQHADLLFGVHMCCSVLNRLASQVSVQISGGSAG